MAQLMEQMAAMRTEMQKLAEENATLSQRVQTNADIGAVAGQSAAAAIAPAAAQIQPLVQILSVQAERQGARDRPSLVDGKTVGRPQTFRGEEQRFPEFVKKLVEPRLEEAMEWALEQEAEITLNMVEDKFGSNNVDNEIPHIALVNQQLKTVLSHLTELDAFSIVQNCGRNGLEA